MTDRKFKSGEVVRLKSGGPSMTVGGYDSVGMVICRWFDGKAPMSDTFDEDSLERGQPETGVRTLTRA